MKVKVNWYEHVKSFIDNIDYDTLFCSEVSTYGETLKSSGGCNIDLHLHDTYELAYFDDNASIETLDGTIVQNLYKCVIYPPMFYHKETLDVVKARETIFLRFDVKSSVNLQIPIQVKDIDGRLYWLLNEIHKMSVRSVSSLRTSTENAYESKTNVAKTDFCNQILADTYLKAVLLNIGEKEFHENPTNVILMRCLNYINLHFDEAICLDSLIKICYVSPSYLNRVFKKHMGVSPMKHLNIVRINHGKMYLAETHLSIGDIATMVGYFDAKYFSRIFKGITGVTPSKFREL